MRGDRGDGVSDGLFGIAAVRLGSLLAAGVATGLSPLADRPGTPGLSLRHLLRPGHQAGASAAPVWTASASVSKTVRTSVTLSPLSVRNAVPSTSIAPPLVGSSGMSPVWLR
jgi:hypothetical protein